jgi:hypothetical protein
MGARVLLIRTRRTSAEASRERAVERASRLVTSRLETVDNRGQGGYSKAWLCHRPGSARPNLREGCCYEQTRGIT